MTAFTGFLMELLFDAFGIVSDLAGGETATEQTYFELHYTFYRNLIAFALASSCTCTAVVSMYPASTVTQSVGCGPMTAGQISPTTARRTTSVRINASDRSRSTPPNSYINTHRSQRRSLSRAMNITDRHVSIPSIAASQLRVLLRLIKTGTAMSRKLSRMSKYLGGSRWGR